jgi:hypothetical protein
MDLLMEFTRAVTGDHDTAGFGADGKPFLWISSGGRTLPRVHLALRAENRAQVDAFYSAAMAAGAKDNGPPGVRKLYHPHYYGAYVLDTDGHNLEAVCHLAPAVTSTRPRAATASRRAKANARTLKSSAARKSAGKAGKARRKTSTRTTKRSR